MCAGFSGAERGEVKIGDIAELAAREDIQNYYLGGVG
jgi:hypothetical protein